MKASELFSKINQVLMLHNSKDAEILEINTELQLNVKKGNRKPIPANVWLISMQSSENCISRELGMCGIADDCYVLAYERNPFMRDQTLRCRDEDEAAIDYLVSNNMGSFLANELIRRDSLSRNHHLEYLRWNESGDMKSLDHFLFVDEIADIVYDGIGAVSVIYTKRKDLWDKFKKIRKSDHLIVNGSDFMADNEFLAVEEFHDGKDHCSSNCEKCFEEDLYWCYNIENTGRSIEEKLRKNKRE